MMPADERSRYWSPPETVLGPALVDEGMVAERAGLLAAWPGTAKSGVPSVVGFDLLGVGGSHTQFWLKASEKGSPVARIEVVGCKRIAKPDSAMPLWVRLRLLTYRLLPRHPSGQEPPHAW